MSIPQGKRFDDEGAFIRDGQVGDWYFAGNDDLYIHTPGGTARLPVDPKCREEWGGPCWQWDGNRDAPTVTPSISIKGEGEWHGYMTKGQLVSV